MALLKCPDCERDVSDKAASCPNCGSPISTNQGTVTTGTKDAHQNSPTISAEVASLLPFEAKGLGSTVTFDGKFIVISRGLMNPIGKGETKIAISSVNSIEWRPPGLQSGFLRFNVAQGEIRGGGTSVDRTKDAVKDVHAVMAMRKHSSDLLKMKDLIEQIIHLNPRK